MLTRDDLKAIKELIQDEGKAIRSELGWRMDNLGGRMDTLDGRMGVLEKDVKKIKKDLSVVVNYFDKELIKLKKRVDQAIVKN